MFVRCVTLAAALFVAMLFVATACEPAHQPRPAPSSPSLVAPGCTSAGPSANATTGLQEAQGTGPGVSLWALFFNDLKQGQEIKIVWRMTGTGDLSMHAVGPDGRTTTPIWGPEGHGSSNWERPGDEWGTGWVFPVAGCWIVQATRQSGNAQLALSISG
jgi:hypothetical protein